MNVQTGASEAWWRPTAALLAMEQTLRRFSGRGVLAPVCGPRQSWRRFSASAVFGLGFRLRPSSITLVSGAIL